MRISRLVLTGAAVGTIIGTGLADLNDTHVLNPGWPPHARFHNATGWGTVAGSQLLALWLLVVALFLTGGIKTILALRRPGARQGFLSLIRLRELER